MTNTTEIINALWAAREYVECDRASIIEYGCDKDEDGDPDLSTLADYEQDNLAAADEVLETIDRALAILKAEAA